MKRALLVAAVVVAAAVFFRPVGTGEDPRVLSRIAVDSTPPARHPREAAVFDAAVTRAWAWADSVWEPRTGFFRTVPEYPVATIWDIGSGLAILVSARELGVIERPDYALRLDRLLDTLERLPLFDGAAFNKTYATATGRMLDRSEQPSTRGYGWSAIDLGRLLVWLRIVADREPDFAPAVERIIGRLDFGRLVEDGYLVGEDLDGRGRPRTYREGTLGYEQYAARGFALWGHPPERALSVTAHARPAEILGQTVLVDERPRDCLTSEPFVLAGLEVGWSPALRRLAVGVLRVQQARYEQTGTLTLASEDASLVPPHHFYYYCIRADGEAFVLYAAGHVPAPGGPRTVSVKGALGWYALLPGEYTGRLLEHVAEHWQDPTLIAALAEQGANPVGPPNVNTAAALLEAAAYLKRGRPLLGY